MNYFDTLFAKKLAGGGSSPNLEEVTKSYTANGDDVIEPSEGYDGISRVNVSVNVSGGGEAPENDVEFIDYDGTIVYSYTAQEFLALDAMPANPTHEGLTAQGWNWSLADAKEYVGDYDKLVIGQQYITDDGKTRVYIHLDEGRLAPYFGVCIKGTATISWGDGSADTTITKTMTLPTRVDTQHTYPSAGDYVITITPPNGDSVISFDGHSTNGTRVLWAGTNDTGGINRYYQAAIKKVELGSGFTYLDTACFYYAQGLKEITIPNTITVIRANSFSNCSLLTFVTFPEMLSGLNGSTFSSTGFNRGVFFPKTITHLDGSGYFSNAKIPRISTPIETTDTANQLAQNCSYLKEVIITKKVTSIYYQFISGSYITHLTIPSTVTDIAAYALYNLVACGKIQFAGSTPPTVSASSAFQNLPTDCKIYVPYSEDHSVLNAYKTATNYPSSSTYTYVEY